MNTDSTGGLNRVSRSVLQGAYAGFVYTYAVEPPMSLPHKTAGYLASIFWAAITVGRLISIPLNYRFQPVKLLMVNLVMTPLVPALWDTPIWAVTTTTTESMDDPPLQPNPFQGSFPRPHFFSCVSVSPILFKPYGHIITPMSH